MDNDLQMARGEVEGCWNLAIGEPVVLQEHLRFPIFETQGPFKYPTLEGDAALVSELQKLYPGHHVVVANGAKQALLAAFWALKEAEGRTEVRHEPPYWPSFPTLAKMAGLWFNTHLHKFKSEDEAAKRYDGVAAAKFSDFAKLNFPKPTVITLDTLVNNPDGRRATSSVDILDAVYAHGLYGWNGAEPDYRIRVGSASKTMGLSGIRVGWMVTREAKLAEYASRYVEFATSGVSEISQEYVYRALRHMGTIEAGRAVGDARDDMFANGRAFMKHLGEHCAKVEGFPTTHTGMFAYFQVKPDRVEEFSRSLLRAGVLLVTGEACGETSPGWWRMNMAHNTRYTEEALTALGKEMDHALRAR